MSFDEKIMRGNKNAAQNSTNRHKTAKNGTNWHKPAQTSTICVPTREGGSSLAPFSLFVIDGVLSGGEHGCLRCSLIIGIIFVVFIVAAQYCCRCRGRFWPLPRPILPPLVSLI